MNEEKDVTWNNVTEGVNLSDYSEQDAEITESQNEEPVVESENTVNDTNGDSEELIDVFEVEGNEYSYEDIIGWKKDADNKSSWNKSNTEKAQNLARVGSLADQIGSDPKLADHIKDYFFENKETLDRLGLDQIKSFEEKVEDNTNLQVEENVTDPKLDVMKQQIEELAIDKKVNILNQQLTTLENDNPDILGGDDTIAFLEYVDNNGLQDLDGAFKEWSYPKLQEKLQHYQKINTNKSKNRGKVINTSNVGAKGESNVTPVQKWKDISMDNPDIKKYFE